MKTSDEAKHRAAALKSLGEMIRRQRQSSRWTFLQLSEKTGVDSVTISAVECGEDVATESELEVLCEFLGMKVDTFPKLLSSIARQQEEAQRAIDLQGSNIVDLEKRRSQWQKTTSRPEA
ncbi:helix-turn-helix domain-containing protein [Sinorhizobium alkalisoli]|uniref:HTH cro/C1-type domain-containing protein n=1 Tax=Sinorhizobium alkalisoli TaxID=1752398 RepID=A0A1E3VFE8_9HYPH|nr:helix-turn-helix transcriptional regulator [Sinorhizobium alkalisoli]ODR92275.1 hypothetical protein A8M32_05465 [Sinorhizobium alkalisoli]